MEQSSRRTNAVVLFDRLLRGMLMRHFGRRRNYGTNERAVFAVAARPIAGPIFRSPDPGGRDGVSLSMRSGPNASP